MTHDDYRTRMKAMEERLYRLVDANPDREGELTAQFKHKLSVLDTAFHASNRPVLLPSDLRRAATIQ